MASILQIVISRGVTQLKAPETVSRLKTVLNNLGLYGGLVVYTALGAWVFQLLELPSEKERLQTNLALLLADRQN